MPKMTKNGAIKLYSKDGKMVKKWGYRSEKNRKNIIRIITRDYAISGHYYQIRPYVYDYKNGGLLLPGNLDDIKRLKSLSLKKQ